MDNKLYKMMNWPEIESIIYSECDHPHEILGKHSAQAGSLIQCFFPGAVKTSIFVKESGLTFPMEVADEEGFFAFWTGEKDIPLYEYKVEYADGTVKNYPEFYGNIVKPEKTVYEKLYAGILYNMYEHFGAKETEIKGIRGTVFTVYAPMAERVSVVGDFNDWDGRLCQMSRLGENCIFTIFIPGVLAGALYKFEIKLKNGLTYLKRDPFAFKIEKGHGSACVVSAGEYYPWTDAKFVTDFKGLNTRELPVNLGELNLDKLYDESLNEVAFSDKVVDICRKNKYTSVCLNDLSKFSNKENCDFGTLSLFALNEEKMPKNTIKRIVNALHDNGIPVFFTIDLSCFNPDVEGLKGFDGRKLFECEDDRPIDGSLTFNFSNKYVRNYLISVAFYYIKALHADGFVFKGIDRILYLNYGRGENDYTPNMFGGFENTHGEELLKHLNSILHKKYSDIVTIATDSLYSNSLTSMLDENGFGFDYKLSGAFYSSMINYMSIMPKDRKIHHSALTNISVNAFCEEFIMTYPESIFGNNEKYLLDMLTGTEEEKIKQIKLMLAALYVFPGKKSNPFTDVSDKSVSAMLDYLNDLYLTEKSLNELDDSAESFDWLDAIDSEHSTISFIRKGRSEKIVFAANYSDETVEINIQLPSNECYRELFDTEEKRFGGKYTLSDKEIKASKSKKNGKSSCITVKLAPLSLRALKLS